MATHFSTTTRTIVQYPLANPKCYDVKVSSEKENLYRLSEVMSDGGTVSNDKPNSIRIGSTSDDAVKEDLSSNLMKGAKVNFHPLVKFSNMLKIQHFNKVV